MLAVSSFSCYAEPTDSVCMTRSPECSGRPTKVPPSGITFSSARVVGLTVEPSVMSRSGSSTVELVIRIVSSTLGRTMPVTCYAKART